MKWRYELYYLDVCIGLLLASAIIAFTLGTMGAEMTFGDRWLVSGMRSKAFVALGAVTLNLGNFLLLAAMSLREKLAPFLSTLIALAVTLSWIFWMNGANIAVPIIVLAMSICVAVWLGFASFSAPQKTTKRRRKAQMLSVLGGIFWGGFYPLARNGLYGDIGVGPYGGILLIAGAIVVTALVFGIYFFNIPVSGPPVGLFAYRSSSLRNHAIGWLSGTVYAMALITLFLGLGAVSRS